MAITAYQEQIIKDKFNELANKCMKDCAMYLGAFLDVMQREKLKYNTTDSDIESFAYEAFLHNLKSFIKEENAVRAAKDILR